MDFEEKIQILRSRIKEELLSHIDNNYVLWDVPYYNNIGDVLIWEGERALLQELPYKCLGFASYITCTFPRLDPEVIILLQGGGNFGDIWRPTQEFRLKVCQKYPNNKIIILPQTVFYEDSKLLERDAILMSQHQNLIICGRDEASYHLLKQHFNNKILLVPDMAFYIVREKLQRFCKLEQNKILFLRRTDKESPQYDLKISKVREIEIHDWPTFEKRIVMNNIFEMLLLIKEHFKLHILNRFMDKWAKWIYRKSLIRIGVRFLSQYKIIYTNRLHGLILGILLCKKCVVVDNSYGKNSSFFYTWLKDLEGVEILRR